MTEEKAIEQLKLWLNNLYPDTDIYHAVAMAIEALKERRPMLEISKTVNREELENIIKNSPMMLITPGTEKIELIREQQWIPCSKRLPEGEALCCDIHKNLMIGYVFVSESSNTGYNAESEHEYMYDCVGWMPLPVPWGGEE